MTDASQPIATIYPQVLSTTAIDGAPTVLVDDPVHLVNDASALTGSQTTAIEDLKVNTSTNAPKITIQQRR